MIKNVILDLGGVILDIDYQLTTKAFKNLGASQIEDIYAQYYQSDLLIQFETGKISADAFRKEVKNLLKLENLTNEAFDRAWNAMLIRVSQHCMECVGNLQRKYRIFLFSNTNEIHYPEISFFFKRDVNVDDFESLFEKVYYSNVLGIRKPDTQGFEYILLENDLNPRETVFVDDTKRHVAGARKAGLHGIFLDQNHDLLDLPDLIMELEV